MRRLGWGVAACLALLLGITSPTAAALPDRGLSVTPVRQFVTVQAGQTVNRTITIADDTSRPMTVDLGVKKFSVRDLSYDFEFEAASDNHVGFMLPSIELKARESRTVSYTISLPADSPPGGSYYALFATTQKAGADQQFEAVSLLYLTANGKLLYGSDLPASSIDHLVFGGSIPYTLDIANSGNSHYFVYLAASLRQPLLKPRSSNETHLLLPSTIRHFQTSLPGPLLPGIYKVSYGYSTEYQPAVTRVSHVVYVPPWSIAACVVLAGLAIYGIRRQLRDSSPPPYK